MSVAIAMLLQREPKHLKKSGEFDAETIISDVFDYASKLLATDSEVRIWFYILHRKLPGNVLLTLFWLHCWPEALYARGRLLFSQICHHSRSEDFLLSQHIQGVPKVTKEFESLITFLLINFFFSLLSGIL